MKLLRLSIEVRPIVQAAAAVYVKHTTPWLVGLIVHGSAVKGGYIPGCSDIDFQLYLDEAAFYIFRATSSGLSSQNTSRPVEDRPGAISLFSRCRLAEPTAKGLSRSHSRHLLPAGGPVARGRSNL